MTRFITLLFSLVLCLSLYTQNNYEESVSGVNIKMIYVEGGTFTMGCTSEQGDDCRENEKPAHKVSLSGFYIGKYPVTNQEFEAVMGSSPSRIKGCPDCPVENVNWFEAQEFIEKLNEITGKKYRLPTEAEWEYSARGGVSATINNRQSYKYSGSNNIDEVAWYQSSKESRINPVGLKKPNKPGIYDMSGNVWEWCSDWYGEYTPKPKTNPTGVERSRFKVLRGGSWIVTENNCRVSARHRYFPNTKTYDFGFRIASDAK